MRSNVNRMLDAGQTIPWIVHKLKYSPSLIASVVREREQRTDGAAQ